MFIACTPDTRKIHYKKDEMILDVFTENFFKTYISCQNRHDDLVNHLYLLFFSDFRIIIPAFFLPHPVISQDFTHF